MTDYERGYEQGKAEAMKVQEPVAWRYRGNLHEFDPSDWAEGPVTPLYTTPQTKQEHTGFIDSKLNPIKRQWVELTDEEIDNIYEQHHNQYGQSEFLNYERAIEAKLKEKNT